MLTGDLKKAFDVKNLKKAWFWIKTNPDAFYKQYYRHLYRSFSLAEDELLLNLSKRLMKKDYNPSFSTKIYVPKKSGILRPITLLTVEDQIVYQALTNIVAEKMYAKKHIKESINKKFYGNIYGGKDSFFFYDDWKIGYKKFQVKFESEFFKGFNYTASFDLTACYDSISHMVLEHQLLKLRLDKEFCNELKSMLVKWSSFEKFPNPIYHGHGIPQGPLSSGLIAEVVLQAFDLSMNPATKTRYFRYVDDIRILAKDQKALRTSLIKLDLRSKSLGLFPQSSKIDIHKITNVEDEIKKIDFSQNNDFDYERTYENEKNDCKDLIAKTPRFKIESETEFKFLLSKVRPKYGLQSRLVKILELYPHLYRNILNSFSKLPKFSDKTSSDLFELLKKEQLYYSYQAKFITLLRDRISKGVESNFIAFCKRKIGSDGYKNDAEFRVAINSVMIKANKFKYRELNKAVSGEKNWWARAKNLTYLSSDYIGEPSYKKLLMELAKSTNLDSNICSIDKLISSEVSITTSEAKTLNKSAQIILKKEGKVNRVYSKKCSIQSNLEIMFSLKKGIIWKKVLGGHYKGVHKKLHRWISYNHSDPSAWVNITDTINDIVLNSLMSSDGGVGVPPGVGGKMGSVLNAPTGRLARKYPRFYEAVVFVHELRLESDLSHPVTKSTGKYTRFITYKEMKKIKKLLKKGYEEIWNTHFSSL